MQERPIQDLVDGLLALGVEVSCSKGTGCPPVEINAKGLRPGKVSQTGDGMIFCLSFTGLEDLLGSDDKGSPSLQI